LKVIENPTLRHADLGKWPKLAMIAGGIGLLVFIAFLFFLKPELYMRAYLIGYMFWLNIGLGSLLLLMIQHLSGGAWGVVIRRVLEASSRNIKWMALLFIPIMLPAAMHGLYEWTHKEIVAHDEVLQQKAAYLNETGFYVRAVVYFIIWALLAHFLGKWSVEQDKTANPRIPGRMRNLSGPGIVIFFLLMTFAGVDWILSLEPHYYSTMFGPIVMIGQALAAMAFTIAVLVLLSRFAPMSNVLTPGHFHDLGKLMFAFVMLWAYINFSQFLITWAANLAEEVPWYLRRTSGGWQWIAGGLILFHFILPFSALLNRELKRRPQTIIIMAIWIIVVRFFDLCFLILPSYPSAHGAHGAEGGHADATAAFTGHLHIEGFIAAFAVFLGIGGFWLTMFFRNLGQRPLIPVNDPYLQEALEFRGGH